MNWTEILTNLGIFTVGSISIVSLLAFLAKRLFDQYLQKGLDEYRSQLERERDAFKHQLQLMSQEHQIRYSRLHNDRAEIIHTLYDKLVKMETAMGFYIFPAEFAGDPSRSEKRVRAGKAANEFLEYFHSNDVFFDDSVSSLVNDINDLYRQAWVDIIGYDSELTHVEATREPLSTSALEDAEKALTTIEERIPPLKQQLKALLQDLLGVVKPN